MKSHISEEKQVIFCDNGEAIDKSSPNPSDQKYSTQKFTFCGLQRLNYTTQTYNGYFKIHFCTEYSRHYRNNRKNASAHSAILLSELSITLSEC